MTRINIRNRVIFILMSFALIAGCGESEVATTGVGQHLDRANSYEEQGQYKAAIIEYKNAVKKSSGESEVMALYASMLLKIGQYESALDILQKAEGPKSEEYYITQVKAYQGLHKYVSAGKVLKESLSAGTRVVSLLTAENSLGMGDFKKAISQFDLVLSSDSNDSAALLGKATALIRSGEIQSGRDMLDKIANQEQEYNKAQLLKAGLAIESSELEDAESILTNMLSNMRNTDIMEPEKAVVLERLSYVLTRLGRSNEAYIYTKLLSEAFPGSNELKERYQVALEKLREGDLVSSKEILSGILDQYPNYKQATQLLGVISYLQGDTSTASTYLAESVDAEVANEFTKQIYAATNLKLNHPEKVLEILEPTIEKAKDSKTLALYGLAAISANQFTKGESALKKAASLDPDNVHLRLALANYYRKKSIPDLTKEWEQLKAAQKIDETDINVLKEIVSFHYRNNEPNKASSFIDNVRSKHSKSFGPNMISGYLALQKNDQNRALDYFSVAEQASKGTDKHLLALVSKGRVLVGLKKHDKAKLLFEEVIKLYPANEQGYKGLLSVYAILDKRGEGHEKLEAYAKRNAQIAPYLVLVQAAMADQDVELAKTFFEKARENHEENENLKHVENAIKYIEASLALRERKIDTARSLVAEILSEEPENIRLLSFLVDLEVKDGRLTEAKKILSQIENINSRHQVVNLLKGEIAAAERDFKGAAESFSAAWSEYPTDHAADKLYIALGMAGDGSAQTKHLASWLEKFPQSIKAITYQSLVYQSRGQNLRAMEGYEKVLEKAPNHVMVLNNLGWIYFEKGDFDKSLSLLEKATELAPNSPPILDSYGWVLFKSGSKEGLKYLKKAHELLPENKEIEEHYLEAKSKS